MSDCILQLGHSIGGRLVAQALACADWDKHGREGVTMTDAELEHRIRLVPDVVRDAKEHQAAKAEEGGSDAN